MESAGTTGDFKQGRLQGQRFDLKYSVVDS